jgi:hypothetical protein
MSGLTPEQIHLIQLRLGRLAVEVSHIDIDAFLEATEGVSSPQAAAQGMSIDAINSAAAWTELARRLQPFRDRAIVTMAQIEKERDRLDDDVVAPAPACPQCGEVRMDFLEIQDDESVNCTFCGHRYSLPGKEEPGA